MKSEEDNLVTLKYLLERIETEDDGSIVNAANQQGEVGLEWNI